MLVVVILTLRGVLGAPEGVLRAPEDILGAEGSTQSLLGDENLPRIDVTTFIEFVDQTEETSTDKISNSVQPTERRSEDGKWRFLYFALPLSLCLSVCLSASPSVCLSVCMSLSLYVSFSLSLSIYISIYLFV